MRNALLCVGLLTIASCDVMAQQICAPRAALIQKLESEFQEVPDSIGVTTAGGLFEILVSPAGTWTMLATGPGGISCLVLSGEGFTSVRGPVVKTKGS